MSHPSEKATSIAEELVDYVHPGMSHNAAVREIATMIDSMNVELLEVTAALLREADTIGLSRQTVLLNQLSKIVAAYEPVKSDSTGQHELFALNAATATNNAHIVPGQMP